MRTAELAIEDGELGALRFLCVEGCGHCCQNEPALTPGEVTFFSDAFPDRVVPSLVDPSAMALRLQGGEGACTFLDGERKCGCYANRPWYCRMYPVHVTSTWRLQAVANRSCRGLWAVGGTEPVPEEAVLLSTMLETGLQEVSREDAATVLADTAPSFHRLKGWEGPEEAHDALRAAVQNGTSRPLHASADRAVGSIDRALEDTHRAFRSERPLERPPYTDPELRWWSIRSNGSSFEAGIMSANGSADASIVIEETEVAQLAASPPTEDGWAALTAYARILADRDATIAQAARQVGRGDAPLTEWAPKLLRDLLWGVRVRSALLAQLAGRADQRPAPQQLAESQIAEGVTVFDQEMLDRPGLGSHL